MATDDTEETTKEQPSPRARTARRPLEEADEPVPDDRARPRPGRRPEEEEPEPLITPGSFSRTLGHVALALLAVAVLYTAWQHSRRDNGNGEPRDGASTTTIPGGEPDVSTTLADPGEPVEPDCPPERGASQPVRRFSDPPPMCIDPSGTYVATVETSRGEFEITLDADAAPQVVNNFVFLARWRFYEGAGFHRVEPGYVMDTGDPVGRPDLGRGGPGYTLRLPPPGAGAPPYQALAVTTVLTADGETNGSQFSIMTGEVAAQTANGLAPELKPTVFGRVNSGQEVIQDIDATGDELTGSPMAPTEIRSITIDEQ